MSKKTLALLIFLISLSVILVIAALSFPHNTTQNQMAKGPTITPTPYMHSVLTIDPNPVTLTSAGLGQASVMLDTGGNQVTTVQLELTYDPTLLTNVDITPGTFFKNPTQLRKSIDTSLGRVSYAIAISPSQTAVSGQGVIAKLTFAKKFGAPVTATQTPITFLTRTLVTAQGVDKSVLKSSTGTIVMLSGAAEASNSPTVRTTGVPIATPFIPATKSAK